MPLAVGLRADDHAHAAIGAYAYLRALLGCADRGFHVVCQAQSEQVSARGSGAAARGEALPVGDLHGQVHVGFVLPAVVAHAHGVAVGHGRRGHEISAPQFDAVDAEVRRRGINQPLDGVGHLRPAGAAIRRGRRRVGENSHGAQRGGRNVVGAGDQARAFAQGGQGSAARADVRHIGRAQGKESSILVQRKFHA